MRDLESPTFARWEKSCTESMSLLPASRPPLIPNVRIAPCPLVNRFEQAHRIRDFQDLDSLPNRQEGDPVRIVLFSRHFHYAAQDEDVMFLSPAEVK